MALWRIIVGENVENLSDQIGERLQKTRELAGLSVDDVMFRTHIPKAVIVALEEGDFTVFSSPTYAKSFLSQYSEFLNVDAGLWLDALQPAPFIAGEIVRPVWEATSQKKEEPAPERASSNGWLSAVSVLAFTVGMVYAAMRGYEFFETRFAGEINPSAAKKVEEKLPVQSPSPQVTPKLVVETFTPAKQQDEELSRPPPRAIIVR